MNWSTFCLELSEGSLAGKSLGRGSKLLLCLHGFGNSRDLFDPVLGQIWEGEQGEQVQKEWTVVSLDLPLFGESEWKDKRVVMEERFLGEVLLRLKQQFHCGESLILGFSLGAKLGIGLVQAGGESPEAMILLAPDGLKVHPLYRFCIYNPVGKRLFRWTVRWPGFFLFIIRALYKLNIADAFKYRFVVRQFAKKKDRELLKNVWHIYSGIRPDLNRLGQKSEAKGMSWHVIWGKKDSILPLRFGEEFCEKIPRSRLYVLDGGHLLIQKHSREVAALLENILLDYDLKN